MTMIIWDPSVEVTNVITGAECNKGAKCNKSDNRNNKEWAGEGSHSYVPEMGSAIKIIVIFLDFHSTKQGLPLVDSWSRGLD